MHFNISKVCCEDLILGVRWRNETIFFEGHKLNDGGYWIGNRIMVSPSDIIGIDSLVRNASTKEWMVCLNLYQFKR